MSVFVLSLLVLLLTSSVSARISPRLDAPLCSTSFRLRDATVQLDAWGDDSIRIRASPDEIQQIPPNQALLPFPPGLVPPPSQSLPCSVQADDELTNGNLKVTLSSTALQAVRVSDGAVLLDVTDAAFTPVQFDTVYHSNYSLYAVSISYNHLHGRVYGLGEHKTNRTAYDDYSHLFENSQVYDYSNGGDISIPFYISSSGFGVLYNQAGYGSIHITQDAAVWTSNATHQLDLWITVAPADSTDITPFPALSRNYAEATGYPNVLPHYASGFWQSKDRYRNQSELLEVAAHFHRLGVQLGVLVIDWQHWHYLGDWTFWKAVCWPDPSAMAKQISSYGTHTMVSAWPRVDVSSSHYAEMARLGYLTTDAKGSVLMSAETSNAIYDPFNPAAREYVWQALLEGYVVHGIQLFWLDAAEPEQSRPGLQWWGGKSDREVGMSWVIHHQRMIFEGSIASGIAEDQIIMLSRHGWIGSPLFNAFIWSGDLESSWNSLIIQVKLAPNVALSGLHWWATDIGGYFGGQYEDDNFNELLVRWFQWGAFLPIFRVHGHREPSEDGTECGGGGGPNELWTYQHEAEIAAVISLRELIRPYVELHLRMASETGVPILQPMWYNFTDAECGQEEAETQYMFGPSWLVAPVLQYQATSRSVYLPRLPAGELWVHYYSGASYKGGQRIDVNVTLADFPLFQREMRTEPGSVQLASE